jgi:hypothetical protein
MVVGFTNTNAISTYHTKVVSSNPTQEGVLDTTLCSQMLITLFFLVLHGTIVVVIVWQLDLQLPMQSVPITAKVASFHSWRGVLDTTLCAKVCQ